MVVASVGFATDTTQPTVESKFPSLSSGALSRAVLASLPGDVIMSCEGITITKQDLSKDIDSSAEGERSQLNKYKFFVLEQMTIKKLLSSEAAAWAKSTNADASVDTDKLINNYLDSIAAKVTVTDEEVAQVYKDNVEQFKGADFDSIKDKLKEFIGKQKAGFVVNNYINSVSTRHSIQVSESWAKEQYTPWVKNPVEQVRRSGKPSLVSFTQSGNDACKAIGPIVTKIKEKYTGKLKVAVVDSKTEPILAIHYGAIQVPMQFLFDKTGKLVATNQGTDMDFMTRELGKIGLK